MASTRTYDRAESAVFFRTRELFGGLSNMAAGFPLVINGVSFRTSEALYQAARFPNRPDIQRLIIAEASPMSAKRVARAHSAHTRSDWFDVNIDVMRFCLRVKLAQNWQKFSRLLLSTGDRPIVEQSYKDAFWGARPAANGTLTGTNELGRLLMELREQLKADPNSLKTVQPPAVAIHVGGRPVGGVFGT